jgi:hypothetical protein
MKHSKIKSVFVALFVLFLGLASQVAANPSTGGGPGL